MAQWNIFPFDVERPNSVRTFSEADRPLLEFRVACNIAQLLSEYGSAEDIQVDVGEDIDREEINFFTELGIEPFFLENEHEVLIAQLPYIGNTVCTEPGVHSLIVEDENGKFVFHAVIYDPLKNTKNRVHDASRSPLPLDQLTELGDALDIIMNSMAQSEEKNNPPYNTNLYPIAIADRFNDIVKNL